MSPEPEDEAERGSYSQGRWVPPPFRWKALTPDQQEQLKRARRGRNIALALVLAGFVVLFYAIAWVRIAG